MLRALAFYLPQFHPIAENNEWWGPGFTEWTNVSKAKPLFRGHYQPHYPRDLGYYDLRCHESRVAQTQLAQEAGLSGFVYYHYAFGIRRLLERPLNDVLECTDIAFPFALCWANENWTRRWDGGDSTILMQQNYGPEHDEAIFRTFLPYLEDNRYIQVEGRPLVLVYNVQALDDSKRTSDTWRLLAERHGFKGLYLVKVEHFENSVDPKVIGFDAATQFAGPMRFLPGRIPAKQTLPLFGLNPRRAMRTVLYDYRKISEYLLTEQTSCYKRFFGVMPSWDNTARRGADSHVVINNSPIEYERWLREAARVTVQRFSGDEQLIFINAWNEWAEGCHLEPDQRWGKAWIEATSRALASF